MNDADRGIFKYTDAPLRETLSVLSGDTSMALTFTAESGDKLGKLALVWKPRFFGRWGELTPRVVFTGNVERSARLLFKSMLPMASAREAES